MAYDSRAHGDSAGDACTYGCPAIAARNITAPVLLVHGDADADTPVDHARRVFANLHEQKRLILVPGARHNGSLRNEVWDEIERWMDAVLARRDDT